MLIFLFIIIDIQFHVNWILFSVITLLRKHAYSNILEVTPPKTEFSDKNSELFHISAQNIDGGYSLELPHRGGSNESVRRS